MQARHRGNLDSTQQLPHRHTIHMLLQLVRAIRHTISVLPATATLAHPTRLFNSKAATGQEQNHYQVLGVEQSAAPAVIKKAFRQVCALVRLAWAQPADMQLLLKLPVFGTSRQHTYGAMHLISTVPSAPADRASPAGRLHQCFPATTSHITVVCVLTLQKAKALHPDLNSHLGQSDAEAFLRLVAAYEVLSDAEQRRLYDAATDPQLPGMIRRAAAAQQQQAGAAGATGCSTQHDAGKTHLAEQSLPGMLPAGRAAMPGVHVQSCSTPSVHPVST
jgi:hypothetical protein